ncbi:MAG: ferrous iron transporter B [Eggerthellaceae bacterium]|nr:ferrous iron transporter B [Eggerthellaceae bacterium]
MSTTIALVGNPNSGKTTLFNQLTGNHQYVGNWPGVTVERKTGTLKWDKDVEIVDLPGIYSLTPYSSEEIIARDYLAAGSANVIVDIVDASNLERNLYLTTQLMEFGVPVVVALNQMDIVAKRGYQINSALLAEKLGLPVVEVSALRGDGIDDVMDAALKAAKDGKAPKAIPFSDDLEQLIKHLEYDLPENVPAHLRRFYAIKYLECDSKVIADIGEIGDLDTHVRAVEARFGDKADAVVANERYNFLTAFMPNVQVRPEGNKSATAKIDRVVLNRVLAIPIFVVIIAAIYYISISTVGTVATDWANDGVFGDGWYLDPVAIVNPDAGAQAAYDEAAEPYDEAQEAIANFLDAAAEKGVETDLVAANFLAEPPEDVVEALGEDFEADPESAGAQAALKEFESQASKAGVIAEYNVVDEEEAFETDYFVYMGAENEAKAQALADARNDEIASEGREGAAEAVIYQFDGEAVDEESGEAVPQGIQVAAPEDHSAYGLWVPGIPALIGGALEAVGCADWLYDLIMDGIVAGVGAVLGFVPQIMILFFLLAILEGCGYMARVTFILDRLFRRFGLSGKTFIPMIVGTGCGVPGVMASRTIESESARHLTIMTTTFMPCSAKLPIIALIATAVFGGVWWVGPTAYFMGIAAIVISGIILKKTKPFMGETAPYIMELPEYRLPRFVDLLRSMWERAWSFIKKAGTIILLATVVVWFLSGYGIYEGQFMWVGEDLMDYSFLAYFGNAFAWIFAPLGFANWQSASTVITGLIAKENVIGTMAVVFGGGELAWSGEFMQSLAIANGSAALVPVAAFSFMTFQLLCAPCFAAMGAIKREMGGFNKWFWAAIGWECGFAYVVSLIIFQLGKVFILGAFDIWTVVAIVLLALILFGLFRPAGKRSAAKLQVATAEE